MNDGHEATAAIDLWDSRLREDVSQTSYEDTDTQQWGQSELQGCG